MGTPQRASRPTLFGFISGPISGDRLVLSGVQGRNPGKWSLDYAAGLAQPVETFCGNFREELSMVARNMYEE